MKTKIYPSIVPAVLAAALFSLNGREAAAAGGGPTAVPGVNTGLGGSTFGGAGSLLGDQTTNSGRNQDNVGNLDLGPGLSGTDFNAEQLLLLQRGGQDAPTRRRLSAVPDREMAPTQMETVSDPQLVKSPGNVHLPKVGPAKVVAPAPISGRNEALLVQGKGNAPAKVVAAPRSNLSVTSLEKKFEPMLTGGETAAEVQGGKIHDGAVERGAAKESADAVAGSSPRTVVPNDLAAQAPAEWRERPRVEKLPAQRRRADLWSLQNMILVLLTLVLGHGLVEGATQVTEHGRHVFLGGAIGGPILLITVALLARTQWFRTLIKGVAGLALIVGGTYGTALLIGNTSLGWMAGGIGALWGMISLTLYRLRSRWGAMRKAIEENAPSVTEVKGAVKGAQEKVTQAEAAVRATARTATETAAQAATAVETAAQAAMAVAEATSLEDAAISAAGALAAARVAGASAANLVRGETGRVTTATNEARLAADKADQASREADAAAAGTPEAGVKAQAAADALADAQAKALVKDAAVADLERAKQAAAEPARKIREATEAFDAAKEAARQAVARRDRAMAAAATAAAAGPGPAADLVRRETARVTTATNEARLAADKADQASREANAAAGTSEAVAKAQVAADTLTDAQAKTLLKDAAVADLERAKQAAVDEKRAAAVEAATAAATKVAEAKAAAAELAAAKGAAAPVNKKDSRARWKLTGSVTLLLAAILAGYLASRLPEGTMPSTYEGVRNAAVDEWNRMIEVTADDAAPGQEGASTPAAKDSGETGAKVPDTVKVTPEVKTSTVKTFVAVLRSGEFKAATFNDIMDKDSKAVGVNRRFETVGNKTFVVIVYQRAPGAANFNKGLVVVHPTGKLDGAISVGVIDFGDDISVRWTTEIADGARSAEIVRMVHNEGGIVATPAQLQEILLRADAGTLK